MNILAIDPGTEQTAYTVFDGKSLLAYGKMGNDLFESDKLPRLNIEFFPEITLIEGIASYGMPVGATTFETCYFIGRLQKSCELYEMKYQMIFRKDIKMYFCNSMKAKDGNISQALRDRFGDKGTKANPGFFYGISADMWSSTAIAIYGHDNANKLFSL